MTLASGSATSGSISPTGAGYYCFAAYYTPTGSFTASSSTTTTNECFQVVTHTSSVPQFPMGMTFLLGLAIPAMLLVRKRFASSAVR